MVGGLLYTRLKVWLPLVRSIVSESGGKPLKKLFKSSVVTSDEGKKVSTFTRYTLAGSVMLKNPVSFVHTHFLKTEGLVG